MRKRAFYDDPPGGCATGEPNCSGFHIVIPAYDDPLRDTSLTDEQLFDQVIQTVIPAGITHYDVDELDAPADRTFRDAWSSLNGTIQVNMPKARLIHMDLIRRVRDTELAKLDVPYMKALEAGDAAEQTSIAAQKQVLRDIPQTFNLSAYTTPEGLKASWPAELPPQEQP